MIVFHKGNFRLREEQFWNSFPLLHIQHIETAIGGRVATGTGVITPSFAQVSWDVLNPTPYGPGWGVWKP